MCNEQRNIENEALRLVLSYSTKERIVKQLIRRLSACVTMPRTDRPDIVLFNENTNIVYGIEHFRVSSALKQNSNGERVVFASNEQQQITNHCLARGREEAEKFDYISDETYGELCSAVKISYDLICATTYGDYCLSFRDNFRKHLSKMDAYKRNLISDGFLLDSIVLYFLVEIYFPFGSLHQPVDAGCISSEILFLVLREVHKANTGLSGIIFLMRDIIEPQKYSVSFLDFSDVVRSIRRQRMEQKNLRILFAQRKTYDIHSVSFRRRANEIDFLCNIQDSLIFPIRFKTGGNAP